jgi:hypothetical protein
MKDLTLFQTSQTNRTDEVHSLEGLESNATFIVKYKRAFSMGLGVKVLVFTAYVAILSIG